MSTSVEIQYLKLTETIYDWFFVLAIFNPIGWKVIF